MLASLEDESRIFTERVYATGTVPTNTEKRALDAWISLYKQHNLWQKVIAYYPFIGSSIASFSLNIKSTDFTLIPYNIDPLMCTTTGFKPNGINSFWDTQLVPLNHMQDNNGSIAVYARSFAPHGIEIGAASDGSAKRTLICVNQGGSVCGAVQTTLSPLGDIYAPFTEKRFISTSRVTNSELNLYGDGAKLGTSILAPSTLPTIPIYIGAVNNSHPDYFSSNELCSAFIGYGFTEAEEKRRYEIEKIVQNMLGRAV